MAHQFWIPVKQTNKNLGPTCYRKKTVGLQICWQCTWRTPIFHVHENELLLSNLLATKFST